MDTTDTRPPTTADVDALIRRLLCTDADASQAVINEEIVRRRLAVT